MLENQKIIVNPDILQKIAMQECAKLKQQGFAKAIHATHATVNRWCNKKVASVSVKMIRELATYFNKSEEQMIRELGGTLSTNIPYSDPDIYKEISEMKRQISMLTDLINSTQQ